MFRIFAESCLFGLRLHLDRTAFAGCLRWANPPAVRCFHHDIRVRHTHSLLVDDLSLHGLASAKSRYYYATYVTDVAVFTWLNLALVSSCLGCVILSKLWLSEQLCTCGCLLLPLCSIICNFVLMSLFRLLSM